MGHSSSHPPLATGLKWINFSTDLSNWYKARLKQMETCKAREESYIPGIVEMGMVRHKSLKNV